MASTIARTLLGFSAVMMLGVASPTPVLAQTLFPKAENRPDYTRYTTPEACLAAVFRVADSLRIADEWDARVVEDTIPYEPPGGQPARIVTMARGCQTRYPAQTTPSELMTHFQLAVVVGQDAMADTLLRRRLALPDAARDEVRGIVFGAALNTYINARPIRLAAAERILAVVDMLTGIPATTRFWWHTRFTTYARAVMDTALLHRHVTTMYALIAALPDSVRNGAVGQGLVRQAISAEAPLLLPVLRDSGAIAYAARVFARYIQVSKRATSSAADLAPLGTRPGPLDGEFWYNRGGARAIHPAPGKVSLVVLGLRHNCIPSQCLGGERMLQRVIHRFGDALDVTLVAQTQGYYQARVPQTPEQEAEAIRQQFLERQGLPGALVVERTAYTLRPMPDGRRVNQLTPIQKAYAVARPLDPYVIPPPLPEVYVVTSDGTVVYHLSLLRTNERELTAVLASLLTSHAN